jgi:hypothetical protein
MLFARTADLAGVARRLRELAPGVRIDGTDADWRQAAVTLGGWVNKRTLIINHDPDYHAEPNWPVQMNGMHGNAARRRGDALSEIRPLAPFVGCTPADRWMHTPQNGALP